MPHDPGTEWTFECAAHYQRPLLICDPDEPSAVLKVGQWLNALPISTLNIAGPSEATAPGIGDKAFSLIARVLGDKTAPPAVHQIATHEIAASGDAASIALESERLPWWLGLPLRLLERLKPRTQSKNTFLAAALALLVFVSLLLGLVALCVKLLGLRIIAGQIYLGPPVAALGAHATVDATAGFQNSGIKVFKGQRISLRPEGRIHTAMDHANNLTKAVKGIIVHDTLGKVFPQQLVDRYPLPSLDESSVFYRDWCGPEGEAIYSDLLEDCKLRRDLNWGALLVSVMPTEVSARSDPFDALKSNGLTTLNLTPVSGETTIVAERDGWLTFIINEAIISPLSPSQDSQLYYAALKRTAQSLTGDPRHRIPLQSIPLIWFADNNGAFRVTVTSDNSKD
jgi:hypothetical protein